MCISGFLDRDKCQSFGPTRTVTTNVGGETKTTVERWPPGKYCNIPPTTDDSDWECKCNEEDVGKQRFGDCQTLCDAAPISPEVLRICTIGAFGSYFVGAAIHGELKHITFWFFQN